MVSKCSTPELQPLLLRFYFLIFSEASARLTIPIQNYKILQAQCAFGEVTVFETTSHYVAQAGFLFTGILLLSKVLSPKFHVTCTHVVTH